MLRKFAVSYLESYVQIRQVLPHKDVQIKSEVVQGRAVIRLWGRVPCGYWQASQRSPAAWVLGPVKVHPCWAAWPQQPGCKGWFAGV